MENGEYYWVKSFSTSKWEIALFKNKIFRFCDGSILVNPFDIIESPIEMPQ